MADDDKKVKDNDKLTAKDPGHKDYDPLKDAKVRKNADLLHSQLSAVNSEKDTLAKEVEGLRESVKSFNDEKKKKDDEGKTESEKLLERINASEKSINTLKIEREADKTKYETTLGNMKAKNLTQESLLTKGIVVNSMELRGLVGEVTDKLADMKKGDDEASVVNSILDEFTESNKELKERGFQRVKVPGDTPGKGATSSDLLTKLNSLREKLRTSSNYAERNAVNKEIDTITTEIMKIKNQKK